jgi:hypothetical protein
VNTDQLLKDPEDSLTPQFLRFSLGKLYTVYEKLVTKLESEPFNATAEWRFYKDGGAWLCKITRNRKTVFWLSAWKAHLKAAFYFTEKSGEGVANLSIKKAHKLAYAAAPPIGKLKPLIMEIRTEAQLKDLFKVADYKISR